MIVLGNSLKIYKSLGSKSIINDVVIRLHIGDNLHIQWWKIKYCVNDGFSIRISVMLFMSLRYKDNMIFFGRIQIVH